MPDLPATRLCTWSVRGQYRHEVLTTEMDKDMIVESKGSTKVGNRASKVRVDVLKLDSKSEFRAPKIIFWAEGPNRWGDLVGHKCTHLRPFSSDAHKIDSLVARMLLGYFLPYCTRAEKAFRKWTQQPINFDRVFSSTMSEHGFNFVYHIIKA